MSPRPRDVCPGPAAHEELVWFFNRAEIEADQPSNYVAMLGGLSPCSLEAVERRAEALHAARAIHARLRSLPSGQALLLSGLYTERLWPERVERALGELAGAVDASPTVRIEYLRAFARGQTRARSVSAWLDEVLARGGPDAVADWKAEAELACAMAVASYELARGGGPCVVPSEDA